jgi:hypothetical protein
MKCSEKILDLCYLPPEASCWRKERRPKRSRSNLKRSIDNPFAGAEKEKEVVLGNQGRKNREQEDEEPIQRKVASLE